MAVFSHPLLSTVAANGADKQRPDHPALPMTPAEWGQTDKLCLDAGAAMMHMHMHRHRHRHRHLLDAQGRHSLDVQGYRDAQQAVKAAVAMRSSCKSPANRRVCTKRLRKSPWSPRSSPKRSVGLREVDQPVIGQTGLAQFFGWQAKKRVMTQAILHDVADLQRLQALRAQGVIPDAPWSILCVLSC